MLIESITLKNFRQYFETQKIEFSKSTTRNVTVIHGENGSGKTALLNAFNWCLYGVLNLPNDDSIINEHSIDVAKDGETIEAFITLNFIDNNKKYNLTRTIKAEKINKDRVIYLEPQISLEYKDESGQSENIENPTSEINRILPEDLRTYFFFDGERIDNLSKESGSDDVKKAIKNIMGLEILERAISHTEASRKRFRSELKKYGDPKTVHIIEEIETLDKIKEDIHEREKLHLNNLNAIAKEIKDVEDKLKKIEGAKQLQELRDSKTDELEDVKKNITATRKQLIDTMSKQGHLAFSYSAVEEAENILKKSKASSNVDVVTGIKAGFIDDLIKIGTCICGTPLIEGSEHYKHLEKVKKMTTTDQMENIINEFLENRIKIKERKKYLFEELRNIKAQEMVQIQKEKKLKEEIEEIGVKLSGKDSEEISNLENKRDKLTRRIYEINQEIGGIRTEIKSIELSINEKQTEQSKLEKLESKASLTQKRMDVCQDLEDTMKEILNVREKLVREQLQERISQVYEQFLRKGYRVQLSDDYELNVLNDKGNIVGMSQGERQITSLSFIGAIVDIARDQYNKEVKQGFDEGGIYPLVMDSPFGALDSDHRERIAKGIHKLADQVIVIVSTSQWRGEVEEQMMGQIGKEYRLSYNDPRQNKEKPYEFTEVEEVK